MLLSSVPEEWKPDGPALENKLNELFEIPWVNDTWFNFKELVERKI